MVGELEACMFQESEEHSFEETMEFHSLHNDCRVEVITASVDRGVLVEQWEPSGRRTEPMEFET